MTSRKVTRMVALLTSAVALAAPQWARTSEPEQVALLKALSAAKVTLQEGIAKAAPPPSVAISAKYEMDEKNELSLSVYTASKGRDVDAEHNVLEEYSGGPRDDAWKPEREVFKDAEHVARASEQLTLMQLTKVSLGEVAKKAAGHGETVFSVTPGVVDGKPVFIVFAAAQGKVRERHYDLRTGDEQKTLHAQATGR